MPFQVHTNGASVALYNTWRKLIINAVMINISDGVPASINGIAKNCADPSII